MIFYKYRDDSDRTEEIFANGNVWLATASQLNDPLECKTGQILESWKQKCIREMEDAQMAGFLMSAISALNGDSSFYSLSNSGAKRWFQRFKRLDTRKGKYSAIQSFLKDHGIEISRPSKLFSRFEDQLLRVGVFSLSECADNELMWAHYASSHTGLAIGFRRVPGSKLDSGEHTVQVAYDNAKPSFSGGFLNKVSMCPTSDGGVLSESTISFNDPTFRAALSTKPVVWKYEKEWRYFEEASGLFPWPGPIASVVFGLRMPDARRTHYSNLVARHIESSVEFYEITLNDDGASFALTPWLPAT